MKHLITSAKNWIENQWLHLPHLIIRLTAGATLVSHILNHPQWFNSSTILSFIVFPSILYKIIFFLFIGIALYVIYMPKKVSWLIIAMLALVFLNIHIITPFWYNYLLLLIFARIDASMKMVIWALAIQEIWAGLTKINYGYINIIGFFSEPFKNIFWLQIFIGACMLVVPLFEIAIGLGLLLRKKFTPYLTILLHGGAITMLAVFLHYAVKAWIWNVLIIMLILILFKKARADIFKLTLVQSVIIAFIALIPLAQMKTTLVYPLSYRMYGGNEINMTIDGQSYAQIYSDTSKEIPYMSDVIFKVILRRQCNQSEFKNATITISKFMLRKEKVISFECVKNKLLLIPNSVH